MNEEKMKKIIEEEIDKFELQLKEAEYDQFEKKAGVLKGIADFAKAVEKFEESMTIEMVNAFESVMNPLKGLLSDVGKNPDAFLDRIDPKRRSVVLNKKEEANVVSENKEEIRKPKKFYDSLEEALKNKTQSQ